MILIKYNMPKVLSFVENQPLFNCKFSISTATGVLHLNFC